MSGLALAVVAALGTALPAAAHTDRRPVYPALKVVTHRGGQTTTTIDGMDMAQWAAAHPAPRASNTPRLGTTRPVTSCADDGSPGTLRSVLETVEDGDTVDLSQLSCGTITLEQGTLVVYFPENLTIQGPGMDALTIDANHASGVLAAGTGGRIELRDLTLANGRIVDLWGGCVSVPGGSISLKRVRATGCEAHQRTGERGGIAGGALFAVGDISVEDSELDGNTLTNELPGAIPDGEPGDGVTIYPMAGGAVSTIFGDITLVRSHLGGNSLVSMVPGGLNDMQGGAVLSWSGKITLKDSVLTGNFVFSAFSEINGYTNLTTGGGIDGTSAVHVDNSTITSNQVISVFQSNWTTGGAIISRGPSLIIENSTIAGNSSTGRAGAIHHHHSDLQLVNSTISGNSARLEGAVYAISPPTRFDHVTIAFNTSEEDVGGIMLLSGGEIGNSIIFGNTSGGGQPADLRTFSDAWPVTGSHNVIGDAGALALPADTLQSDPLLLPLADNGGATQTHALDDGSPAIDSGSNPNGLAFDQRGLGFARVSGAASDIGAFETQSFDDAIFQNGFD